MAPSRVLIAALALAALPLLSCSQDSVVGPADARDQGLVLADADIAQCPGGPTNGAEPQTCGYPPSYGHGLGRSQLQHDSNSPDRPSTKSQFRFEFEDDEDDDDVDAARTLANPADTLPQGFINFQSYGNAKNTTDDLVFEGGDPFVVQVDLESDNQATPSAEPPDVGGAGTIYVEGPGTMNGEGGWFFCMFANDTHGHPKRSDTMDIRFWEEGIVLGSAPTAQPLQVASCDEPTYHFVGKAFNGDIDAQEGDDLEE